MLSEVHPYEFETHGRSNAVVMAEERFAQELEPPQCLLPESKQIQTGMNEPSGCRTVGPQVFVPPANPGLFYHVCMMQGWQIFCLTELLLSPALQGDAHEDLCRSEAVRFVCEARCAPCIAK